jgi:serine/threonine protein kinase
MVGTSIGPYVIAGKVGEGGMGEVYRARDSKLKRDVALKLLPSSVRSDGERLARFQREAEVLAALNHPNIAHIHGLEESDGVTALVMELVEGEDLAQRLSRGPIPLAEVVPIAKQIADALEAAHDQGIVHRDLKPANIKLRPDGTIKVLDFGLAKLDATVTSGALAEGRHQPREEAGFSQAITSPAIGVTVRPEFPEQSRGVTMHGTILGTAAYMSPEQAKGKPVDKRTDIWAFGCVVFEMLTAKRAFEGEDVTDVVAAVVSKDPDWQALPPSTPVGIRRLLARCLQKDRKQRLRDIGDAHPDLAEDTAPPSMPAPAFRRAPWMITAVAATAGAIALAVPAISHWRETPAAPRTLRLTIDAPPDTTRLLSPEISPDGGTIVFAAVRTSGVPVLWTRRLDEPAATPLPNAPPPNSSAFWSPDGRSFAYLAREGLTRYDLSTSSSRVIARFGSTLAGVSRFSGTWSAESGILYGVGTNIYRVADGGEPRRLTFEGLPDQADNRFPVFLPDGRHFLFLSGDPAAQGFIYLASIDGGPVKKLFPAESQAMYAEPAPGRGHLLFIQDGSLMARPFDLASMEGHGEPFSVAASVPLYSAEFVGTGRGQFGVSRGGTVIHLSDPNPLTPKLTWFDRAGKELGTVGPPALYFGPRIAPDGRRVAVVRLDPRTRLGDIYIIDEQNREQRLTFDPASDLQPVWMPSGEHVIFSSHRNGRSQLFRKRADGAGNEELLYESAHSLAADDVSSDGRFVVFRESHPVTQNDLWVLPLDGSGKARAVLQTADDEPRARFSPDGRVLTYISAAAGGPTLPYGTSFPDLESRWQIVTVPSNVAQWRTDGKEIYYQTSIDGANVLVRQVVSSTAPLRLGERDILFRPPQTPRGSFFHASADGQRFLFAVEPAQPGLLRYQVAIDWLKP